MPTLFRDVFTGDEMFDSSHEKNIVDDIVYSVQGCYTPIYTTHADGKVTVRTAIDIVEKHDLQVVDLSYSAYVDYMQQYVPKLTKYLRNTKRHERLETFQANIQTFLRRIVCNFDDFVFYSGQSREVEDGLSICYFKGDHITPHFYFFMDSLKCEPMR